MELPKHLGVIMDGNRRYAKSKLMEGWKGHTHGTKTFHDLLDWTLEFGIKEITIYAFSTENFNRTKREVDELMKIFRKELEAFRKDERITKHKVHVRFVGRLHLFPEDIQKAMYQFMEDTKPHKGHTLNLAMGYGGRAELVDTIKEIADEAKSSGIDLKEIDEAFVQERLGVKTDIDMVIRTGGVTRTSNFFPWQTAYAEWFFIEKMWPEFTKEDLKHCLEEFSKRERRMGK